MAGRHTPVGLLATAKTTGASRRPPSGRAQATSASSGSDSSTASHLSGRERRKRGKQKQDRRICSLQLLVHDLEAQNACLHNIIRELAAHPGRPADPPCHDLVFDIYDVTVEAATQTDISILHWRHDVFVNSEDLPLQPQLGQHQDVEEMSSLLPLWDDHLDFSSQVRALNGLPGHGDAAAGAAICDTEAVRDARMVTPEPFLADAATGIISKCDSYHPAPRSHTLETGEGPPLTTLGSSTITLGSSRPSSSSSEVELEDASLVSVATPCAEPNRQDSFSHNLGNTSLEHATFDFNSQDLATNDFADENRQDSSSKDLANTSSRHTMPVNTLIVEENRQDFSSQNLACTSLGHATCDSNSQDLATSHTCGSLLRDASPPIVDEDCRDPKSQGLASTRLEHGPLPGTASPSAFGESRLDSTSQNLANTVVAIDGLPVDQSGPREPKGFNPDTSDEINPDTSGFLSNKSSPLDGLPVDQSGPVSEPLQAQALPDYLMQEALGAMSRASQTVAKYKTRAGLASIRLEHGPLPGTASPSAFGESRLDSTSQNLANTGVAIEGLPVDQRGPVTELLQAQALPDNLMQEALAAMSRASQTVAKYKTRAGL